MHFLTKKVRNATQINSTLQCKVFLGRTESGGSKEWSESVSMNVNKLLNKPFKYLYFVNSVCALVIANWGLLNLSLKPIIMKVQAFDCVSVPTFIFLKWI